MRGLPRDLPDDDRRVFEASLDHMEGRISRHVESILDEVEAAPLRQQLRTVAFQRNQLLPKRTTRPGAATVTVGLLVDAICHSYSDPDPPVASLLEFVIVCSEYYDVADDLIDGDVAPGGESEVIATQQVLVPLLVRTLGRLGAEAVEYWTDHATWLAEAPLLELSAEPSWERYRSLLDRQATLHGSMTGLAAVAVGSDDDAIRRAETLGRLHFTYSQCVLDGLQYESDDDDPWNAFSLTSERRVLEQLRRWREAFEAELDPLPNSQARRLRPLVAVDLDRWCESIREEG